MKFSGNVSNEADGFKKLRNMLGGGAVSLEVRDAEEAVILHCKNGQTLTIKTQNRQLRSPELVLEIGY